MTAVDAPDDLAALAEWYAAQLPAYEALNSAMWRAKRRLTEYIRDTGPMLTPHGRLEIIPDGYAYDEDVIAREFPAVVDRRVIALGFTSEEAAERVLSIALEEAPDTTIESTSRTIDKAACARIIKAAGAAGERMAQLRSQKAGKLGVKHG